MIMINWDRHSQITSLNVFCRWVGRSVRVPSACCAELYYANSTKLRCVWRDNTIRDCVLSIREPKHTKHRPYVGCISCIIAKPGVICTRPRHTTLSLSCSLMMCQWHIVNIERRPRRRMTPTPPSPSPPLVCVCKSILCHPHATTATHEYYMHWRGWRSFQRSIRPRASTWISNWISTNCQWTPPSLDQQAIIADGRPNQLSGSVGKWIKAKDEWIFNRLDWSLKPQRMQPVSSDDWTFDLNSVRSECGRLPARMCQQPFGKVSLVWFYPTTKPHL